MRIAIDLQGAQTESRNRGIGRYSIALTKEIIKNNHSHEIVIILNGNLEETAKEIKKGLTSLIDSRSILVWRTPGPINESDPDNDQRSRIAELLRESFIYRFRPDILIVTSLFEGYVDNATTSIKKFSHSVPTAVVLYDLIPLANPHIYLKDPRYRSAYQKKLDYLKNADLFLSISESSSREATTKLKIPKNKIKCISAGFDDVFRVKKITDTYRNDLLSRLSIESNFILYSGGSDERKNIKKLIQAYSQLEQPTGGRWQLVLAGHMPDHIVHDLILTANSAGLKEGELIFTGWVDDETLCDLYNTCNLFVFPSLHEGFGLTVLEAMACGAAVLTSNVSSLPEVRGSLEATFDPSSTEDIKNKITKALTNQDFINELIAEGLARSKQFSWKRSALQCLSALDDFFIESYCQQNIHEDNWMTYVRYQQNLTEQIIREISIDVKKSLGHHDMVELANCLYHNESQAIQFIRASNLPEKLTWKIEGPFDSSYSLAIVNRETARALQLAGHNVMLRSTEGPGDFPPNEAFLNDNRDIEEIYRSTVDNIAFLQPDITSRNLYPPRTSGMDSRISLFHGYHWEESCFPIEWAQSFNESLQGILVGSKHVKKILIDSGVSIPIFVTGNGTDHWCRIIPDPHYTIDSKKFTFLHVSSCFPRKGVDVLLRSYGDAFRITDNVTLIIKTFNNPHNQLEQWLNDAYQNDPDYPHVITIYDDLSEPQLKSLYNQCHALVAPSRAEGFGLPMAEAMLSGMAVITTNWGGQLDFCTPESSWLVDYKYIYSTSHFGIYNSVWAEPDSKHLSTIMKEVYQTDPLILEKRAKAASSLLINNFRWSHVAEKMVTAARIISIQTEPSFPRIGWVTTWNRRCGIASYSAHLIEQMPSEITILSAANIPENNTPINAVVPCWTSEQEDNLNRLSYTIKERAIDTLIIQFNYGFFDFNHLSSFIIREADRGVKILIFLHSTIDPQNSINKKLYILKSALERCARILVHTVADLNRLKSIGLVNNACLFPHGVLSFKPSYKKTILGKKAFNIYSYGFFLPQKGLLELIDAVKLLKDHNIDVKLNMLNAEYSPEHSGNLIQMAHKKINDYNLIDFVTLSTDYITDSQALEDLSQADLIVFPYQDTNESASGAARYGLASGAPVMVTPIPIFDDIDAAVFRFPGCSPALIAEGIANYISCDKSDSGITQKFSAAESWRHQHQYSILAERLHSICTSLSNNFGNYSA